MKKLTLEERECLRCGHKWVARKLRIRTCPGCKSPYWDTPRKGGAADDGDKR
jgi:predicted Zn-ribbon and HTH transcriptional regulator